MCIYTVYAVVFLYRYIGQYIFNPQIPAGKT